MTSIFSRFFGGLARRSLDAGAGGRRWENAKAINSLNRAMEAAGPRVRQRGAYYAINNAWLRKGINSLVGNMVGTGIKPQSRHPDQVIRERENSRWDAWQERAAITGRTDFYGLQAQAVRSMIVSGEALLRFRYEPGPSLRLQMIAPDQLDRALNQDIDGGCCIRQGVELDADGRRVAYHILPRRPDDMLTNWTPIRVPASEILHVFEPLDIGQVRGLPSVTACLRHLDGWRLVSTVQGNASNVEAYTYDCS